MMQVCDLSQLQSKSEVKLQLLNVLQDIANQVDIHSDFSIHHPNYQPLGLAPDMLESFYQLPKETQRKYLSLQLRNYIYGIYYNGSLKSKLTLNKQPDNLHLDLENHAFLDIDAEFFQQLDANNYGKGYFDSDWHVFREESDGSLAVTKKGLRLYIEREQHLQSLQKNAVVGDSVSILMPKNLLLKGFYMAVGDAGANHVHHLDTRPTTVRIYFNLTSEGAVEVMAAISQHLNEMYIPFRFKVLSNPGDYGRYDSGVLYFDKRDYQTISPVIQTIYCNNQSYFQPQVPLFTKYLAPGLGLAEEVDQKFTAQESFGMNRCQIVANGLLASWETGDELPEARMKSIIEQFSSLGIDLQRPYLNANSDDIYQLIQLG